MGKCAGPIRLGSDGVDVGSSVEVFHHFHSQVLGLLNFSEDFAMEGVVGAYLLPLSGDCQEGAFVDCNDICQSFFQCSSWSKLSSNMLESLCNLISW